MILFSVCFQYGTKIKQKFLLSLPSFAGDQLYLVILNMLVTKISPFLRSNIAIIYFYVVWCVLLFASNRFDDNF